MINSSPEAYYLVALSEVSDEDAKIVQGEFLAGEILNPRRESTANGSPFFALNEKEHQDALKMLDRHRQSAMDQAR